MNGLSHDFSVCTIYGAILKNHVRNWNVTTTSGEIDADLYLAVLQAAKQAQSAA